ncbi:MAG: hypothetical protein AAGA70_12065 [Pseudomonadota bacterium]
MAAALAFAHPTQTQGPAVPDRALLDWLRGRAARARSCGSADCVEACAILGAQGRDVAAETCARLLFCSLPRLLENGRLRLYEPGAVEQHFDEAWLMAALSSVQRRDTDSLTFLLARRLPRWSWRSVHFLLQTLADALDSDVTDAKSILGKLSGHVEDRYDAACH